MHVGKDGKEIARSRCCIRDPRIRESPRKHSGHACPNDQPRKRDRYPMIEKPLHKVSRNVLGFHGDLPRHDRHDRNVHC